MVVLVTGGAGYVGSTVIRELLRTGDTIISFDNLYRGDYGHLSAYANDSRLKMVVGDVSSIETLRDSLKGVQGLTAIIHLAAIPGLVRCLEDPQRAILTNVLGTFNVLEVAREYDAQKVVFASSAAVYGVPKETPILENHPLNPINLYGVTKLDGEKLVEAHNYSYGLNTVILRFGNIYGVGLFTYWETVIPKFVKQALEGNPLIIYGSGEQSRDFIHVMDVSNAIMLVMGQESVRNETFNLGGARSVSVNAISSMVSEILKSKYGREAKIVHLPPRRGEPYVEDFYYSMAKIESKLGFRVQWSLKKGINQICQYLESTRNR